MRSPIVVPPDPPPHGSAGVREVWKGVLPDALFLQAAEEALDHPVLLRRVRGNELLAQPVVLVAAQPPDGGAFWTTSWSSLPQ